MVYIRVEGVTKRFKHIIAVDDVTLSIEDRSFYCILGPPGAGKTTLLRVIAGLDRQDSGQIYFDDQEATSLGPHERGVAVVFQDFALYPHMRVIDNIASPLKVSKIPRSEIDKRVKEVAEFLGIGGLLDRMPWQLSGGEQQRVAIARAMVMRPKVYLLDEPLVNLDYKIRDEMRAEFKRMQKDLGQTIICATPDPVDALSMADKVALMNKGRIEQCGPVDEVYQRPANVFVGRYLGDPAMNIVDSSLVKRDDDLLLDFGLFSVNVNMLRDKLKGAEEELCIGIRPECIHVSEGPPSGWDITVKASVVVSEVVGSDTILHLKMGGHLIQAILPEVYRPNLDTEVWVSFNLEDIHIFNKRTGKTIV